MKTTRFGSILGWTVWIPSAIRIEEEGVAAGDRCQLKYSEGPTIAVHQSDEHLALMDDRFVRTHTAAGRRVKSEHVGIVKLNRHRSNS